MRGKRIVMLFILVFIGASLLVWSAGQDVSAQGENLITNPSFEGPYSSYVPELPQEQADCPLGVCTTAQVPNGWKPWWVKERPTDVNPEFKPAESSAAGNRVHSGQRASQYFSFWTTHKAGLRQTVSVPANSTVVFSVMGQAWLSESDTSLTSDYGGTANMQVGIDPTGGINPYSSSIVWSGYQNPLDSYQPFSVQAQAQGDKVTVFTFSAPSVNPQSPEYGFKHTDVYWDDASLVVVGGGSAPPPPPPPADAGSVPATPATTTQLVPFPTATPNVEGVIYSEVRSGDSLWAIAARAGIALAELLEFNQITEDHIILAGDLLITGYGDPPGTEEEVESTKSTDAVTETLSTEVQPEPSPTAPLLPTTTGPVVVEQELTGGTICLSAYDDLDKDAVFDNDEPLRSNVAITISDGEQSYNYFTDGEKEPFCMELPKPGQYRVSRSSLPNENLTTPGDYSVAVLEGETVNIAYGSYISEDALASEALAASAESGNAGTQDADSTSEGTLAEEPDDPLSDLLVIGIVVAVLLLAGIVILILSKRRTPTEV